MAKLNINGKVRDVEVESDTPLLWVIREQVGLTGTKYGCGVAQCGACSVHINGEVMRSCSIAVGSVKAADKIVTIEGLSANASHPVTRGSYVEIYATGFDSTIKGAVSPIPITDPLTSAMPTVLFSGAGIVGNVEVTPSYAGLAPGFVGLYQINVQIPASLPAGDHIRVQLRTPFNLLSNALSHGAGRGSAIISLAITRLLGF